MSPIEVLSRASRCLRPLGVYPWRRWRAFRSGLYTPTRIPLRWASTPSRIDFLNQVVVANRVHDYLEIGCAADACFSRIRAPRRVGVDPQRGGTIRATSSEFFASNRQTFDLVFVDGLHHHEQVIEDVLNSLHVLSPRGLVVLHDCLPLSCVAQYREQSQRIWNGDVWKAMVEIRTWPAVDASTCLIDHGIGIVVPRPNTDRLDLAGRSPMDLSFDDLAADYRRLLRVVDYEAGLRFACPDAVA